MAQTFKPNFKNVHQDIERYLNAIGQRQKTKDGFIVFHGYDDAREMMFERYLNEHAYEALVNWLRSWNWEKGYNDKLLRLTEALQRPEHWRLLKRLWDGVLAKRKSAYNAVWKVMKDDPTARLGAELENAKSLLLETLGRDLKFAESFGSRDEVTGYLKTIERVKKGGRA